MAFTRTPGGLSEKWRFYSIPTIWVEGPTDIYFYEPMLSGLVCRLEPYHGADNAKALIEGLRQRDYPYVVVLDGDYEILRRTRVPHKNVLRLKRYSIENYFWEVKPVNQACCRHARCGDQKDLASAEMRCVESHVLSLLSDTIALDIAARRSTSPPAVLPERVEPLCIDQSKPELDAAKVKSINAAVRVQIEKTLLQNAKDDLKSFLKNNSVMSILRGHFLFGLLRRVFTRGAQSENPNASLLNNDALMQLLAEAVWRSAPSDEHRSLKYKLRRIVRELLPAFPAQSMSTDAVP